MPPSAVAAAARNAAPKVTPVFAGGGAAGIGDILDDACRDEPPVSPEVQTAADAGAGMPGAPGGQLAAGLAAGGPAVTAAAPPPLSPREAAETTVATLVTVGRSVGGDEWEPDNDQERENVTRGFERYYAIRGTPQLPPELVLAAVVGEYVGKRVKRPRTAEWLRATAARLPLPPFARRLMIGAAGEAPAAPAARPELER